jgi:uracil-DNA glycosylase
MKELLNVMYNTQFQNSVCPCFEECKADNFDVECSFICNRSAKVGKNYSREKTKIVFIGKEDVSSIKEPEEPASFTDTKNQHYRGTKLILAALLGYCTIDNITNKEKYIVGEESLHERFSLTNHYHCTFKTTKQLGKRHGIKNSDAMWDNCAKIVKKELELLSPNIVVIQSGWSARKKSTPESRIEGVKAYFNEKWTVSEDKEIFGLFIAKHNNGNTCYIIGSYHPSFHKWNNELYLEPLKQRVDKVRKIIESK